MLLLLHERPFLFGSEQHSSRTRAKYLSCSKKRVSWLKEVARHQCRIRGLCASQFYASVDKEEVSYEEEATDTNNPVIVLVSQQY